MLDRAALRRLTRSYVDEFGGQWIQTVPDGDPLQPFTVDDYLNLAMDDYAEEVEAFPVDYTSLNVANQSLWSKAAFGVEAADTDSVSVLAAAAIGAMALVAGQPANTYLPRHRLSISVKNNTGAPAVGAATSYTIVGRTLGGAIETEVLSFTAADLTLADQAVVTKLTDTLFTSVTSITAGVGQGAGWQHSAGVGAQDAGKRILRVTDVYFDGTRLKQITKARMESNYPGWATAPAASPRHWWTDGNMFRVYPVGASAASLIQIYAIEHPDNTLWADSAAYPPCDSQDHELLAVKAAHRIIVRNPSEANMARGAAILALWQAKIIEAKQRIHGAEEADVIVGLRAQLRSSSTIERVT